MAKDPKASKPPKAEKIPGDHSRRRFIILAVLCLIGAYFLKLSMIFLCVGMMPAMVAYMIDHDKNKYMSSTVAAFNFSGVFPYMITIYNGGGNFFAVKEEIIDPMVWLTMYSSAALGWGIVWLGPIIAGLLFEGVNHGRIAHLESMQKKLEDEWGPEIRGEKAE